MVKQYLFSLPQFSRGFHLITEQIEQEIDSWPEQGLLHLFLQHTSAGLLINENADPTVREDFSTTFRRLVPDGPEGYRHQMEGPDDMPAHIKSSLVGVSLTIPIREHRLALGTWQGIYLGEFRNHGGSRKLLATVYT